MKRDTEARVRAALDELGTVMPLLVYKPPDDARNWKPADFVLAFDLSPDPLIAVAQPAYLEVKDNPNLRGFPVADLRPSQLLGIREAGRVRVPYWLVIWWRRRKMWSVSDAAKVLHAIDTNPSATSFPWSLFVAPWGVDCQEETLAGTIGAALRGEIG